MVGSMPGNPIELAKHLSLQALRRLGLAAAVGIVFASIGTGAARAQTCTIANNQSAQPSTVTQNGSSCTIPSGQVLQPPGFFPAPGPTDILATGGGAINGSN